MSVDDDSHEENHIVPDNPVPPREIARYSTVRDPDAEADIAQYVEIEAHDETVQHVEKIRTDFIMGERYEVWDVTTDKDRWWVVTNFTNLYSQKHFSSLDYTLSFHIGLMMRMRSRPVGADARDPDPFDEVYRRLQQAKHRHDAAIESEDFQAVGLHLRECLISLIAVIRRRVDLEDSTARPKDADFVSWVDLVANHLCNGESNKQLRQYLKNTSKETWQLVNWLTHARRAEQRASSISIEACDTLVGHMSQLVMRDRTGDIQMCPRCSSRALRTHFDATFEADGTYYVTCGACRWSNHPSVQAIA